MKPPEGYRPPNSVEEFRERLANGETYFCNSDFSNADLSEIELGSVYLFQTNFDSANFEKAKFDQTKFIGSTFIGANLSQVIATHCVMMGADFYKANFTNSDVLYCDARDSCFIFTEFIQSTLIGNWLSGSTFHTTKILDTALSLNDLSNTKHPNRLSFIDIHSIRKSAGLLRDMMEYDHGDDEMNLRKLKITGDVQTLERFFDGCGVPAEGIELFRGWLTSTDYQSVFIRFCLHSEPNV